MLGQSRHPAVRGARCRSRGGLHSSKKWNIATRWLSTTRSDGLASITHTGALVCTTRMIVNPVADKIERNSASVRSRNQGRGMEAYLLDLEMLVLTPGGGALSGITRSTISNLALGSVTFRQFARVAVARASSQSCKACLSR
jgi:hypothetical protein